MKTSIKIKVGVGFAILAFTNPNEEMLKYKIYEKFESSETEIPVIFTRDVAKLKRINFLAFSIASVQEASSFETANVSQLGKHVSPRFSNQGVDLGEVRYVGIIGNWFKLPGIFQSY